MDSLSRFSSLSASLLDQAKRLGATAADILISESVSLSVSQRLREPETLERAQALELGLRVFTGKRSASVSTTDLSREALNLLTERAVAMSRLAPEDPHAGLLPKTALAASFSDFNLRDEAEPDVHRLQALAAEAEDAALSTAGITNSEGADAGWSASRVFLATSEGFAGGYASTMHQLSVSVLAGKDDGMQRDYDFSMARHGGDLEAPSKLGKKAAEKALRKLNPRKVSSQETTVVFDPEMASSLLSQFAGAINGASVARGTSFLKSAMGTKVFAPGIRIVDDPTRKRGLGSKPFDAEGMAATPLVLVEGGVLSHWLLDHRSANQLKLASNGRAARGAGSPPSPSSTNLWMEPGTVSPEGLMKDIKSGFYVTEAFGMGINLTTGDYSQGASGFWIENGEIAYPVSEITIAGKLQDMFQQLTPANDLIFRTRTNAPTLRIERMIVAGS
ncbi:MAG: TldD/PmbA family protein [Alphaproteobacteria bacterium]|nr:TldD/PmbA family protein [Alphaproteobacteria bacterium]